MLLMLLFKNQLYKIKIKEPNRKSPYHQQAKRHKALFQIYLLVSAPHFTNVHNLLSCYHNVRIVICRYQGVTLRNNDKLFREFFVNLSAVIRARL